MPKGNHQTKGKGKKASSRKHKDEKARQLPPQPAPNPTPGPQPAPGPTPAPAPAPKPVAPKCPVTDELAKQVEVIWKQNFSDASLLPVIGLPSNGNGVATLIHTMGPSMGMTIDGYVSKSPLANAGLYSFECNGNGKFINLYEVMVPDPVIGGKSAAQVYVNALRDNGLDVAGVHFHWLGGYSSGAVSGKNVIAVHHQSVGDLDPVDFSDKTIAALQTYMNFVTGKPNAANASAANKNNLTNHNNY